MATATPPEFYDHSEAKLFSELPASVRSSFYESLSDHESTLLEHRWDFWARPKQLAPEGRWYIWVLITGRGWGKNRAASEWIHEKAELLPGSRGALCARTASDVRDTIVNGASGLIATAKPWNKCRYVASRRMVIWDNGTTALMYTSEKPEQLRGPNHHWAYGDEAATWKKIKDKDGGTAYDNMQLSTRLEYNSIQPQMMLTTTPRPVKLIKELLEDKSGQVVITRGSLLENRDNLAPAYIARIMDKYDGTRLGRQEIDGEVLEAVEGAIVDLDMIDACRVDEAPPLDVVVVAVDPAGSTNEQSDETGIVVVGVAGGHGYVLADYSGKYTPRQWAEKAVKAVKDWDAPYIVAEKNCGGDMVKSNVENVDPSVRVMPVHASKSKAVRFSPVGLLYEQGRIHHVGTFDKLEDQVCGFTADSYEGDTSPDSADAMVWGFRKILVKNITVPRISRI